MKHTAATPFLNTDSLEGIELMGEIGRGASSIVYRARREGEIYAVKVLKNLSLIDDANVKRRFYREAGILARSVHPNLVRIVKVSSPGENPPHIVMELVEGEPLASLIARGALDEAKTIEIGIKVASGLAEVHKFGLIHRDLKPQNIVIGREGTVKVIDFGLAMNNAADEKNGAVVGTILYSAPEQTGVLKHTLDLRADLYSLGIVLFECLVGQTPYASADAGELMQQHLNAPVPDLRVLDPKITPMMAQIVARLMAKDPDQRYRSTSSLIADLTKCQKVLTNDQVALTGYDADIGLSTGLPLVGRDEQIEELRQRFARAKLGQGQIALITGEPGSGKTRLLRDVVGAVNKSSGFDLVTAKAQMNNCVPLGTIRELIEGAFSLLAHKSMQKKTEVESRLKQIMVNREAMVKHFSPRLAAFFASAADAVEVTNQDHYYEALADLIAGFAGPSEPLVLLLDDLQWLDDSSVQVLTKLSARVSQSSLMLFTSARNAPTAPIDPRKFFTPKAVDAICQIDLHPLDLFSAKKLIANCIGGADIDEALLKLVYGRSNGNAYATIEFVNALIDGGMLLPSWHGWALNLEGLEALQLPTDVIQLLLQRIESLSHQTRSILKYAAAFSDKFDVAILLAVSEVDRANVLAALNEASEINLVELELGGKYKFVHDRVREAFSSQWNQSELSEIHYIIAHYLSEHHTGDVTEPFALAYHYGLSPHAKNPARVFSSNFKAAEIAYENLALQEAFSFFETAAKAFQYDTNLQTADFEEASGLCSIRIGKFQIAENHFTKALELSTSPLQRARVLGRLALLLRTKGEKDAAWSNINAAFVELKVLPLKKNLKLVAQALFYWLASVFVDRFKGPLTPPREKSTRDRLKALLAISLEANYLGFYDLKSDLTTLASLRSSLWARRLGISREAVHSYCFYAGLAALFRLPKTAEKYIAKAFDYANQLHDMETLAHVHVFNSNVGGWSGLDENDAESRYRRAFQICFKWGAPATAVGGASGYLQRLVRRGIAKDILEISAQALFVSDSIELKMEMLSYQVAGLSMMGRTAEAEQAYDTIEKYSAQKGGRSFKALHMMNAAMYLLERDEIGEKADQLIELYDKSGFRSPSSPPYARAFHVPYVHIRLAQWLRAADAEKGRRFAELEKALAEIKKFGAAALLSMKPEPLIQAHIAFIEAVIAGEKKNYAQASELLNLAENLANGTDCQWILFESFRYRGALLRLQGFSAPAERAVNSAFAIATHQNWNPRLRRLKEEFNIEEASRHSRQTTSLSQSTKTSINEEGKNTPLVRQLEALLQLAIISSKVFGFEARCQAVLKEIVQLMNPERAFLFVLDKNTGTVSMQLGQDAEGNAVSEFSNYSKNIIERVKSAKTPVVITGNAQGEEISSESIVAYDLKSILAAPLLAEGKLVAIIYLDSRVAKGIFTQKDVQLLLAFGNHIAIAIETARATQLELEKGNLQKDLEIVGAVQNLLVPKINTIQVGALEASSYFQPADQAGGDWWWFDQAGDGKLRVFLGDVTGHGVGAAMVTAIVASCCQTFKELFKDAPVDQLAATLNKVLTQFCGEQYWMTFAVLEIDPNLNKFAWWSMAAPEIMKSSGGAIEVLSADKSMPLGSGPLVVSQLHGDFKPGDQMFIFSDGLFEFKTPENTRFGVRRLKKVFSESFSRDGAAEQIKYISEQTRRSMKTPKLEDDITYALVRYKNNAN